MKLNGNYLLATILVGALGFSILPTKARESYKRESGWQNLFRRSGFDPAGVMEEKDLSGSQLKRLDEIDLDTIKELDHLIPVDFAAHSYFAQVPIELKVEKALNERVSKITREIGPPKYLMVIDFFEDKPLLEWRFASRRLVRRYHSSRAEGAEWSTEIAKDQGWIYRLSREALGQLKISAERKSKWIELIEARDEYLLTSNSNDGKNQRLEARKAYLEARNKLFTPAEVEEVNRIYSEILTKFSNEQRIGMMREGKKIFAKWRPDLEEGQVNELWINKDLRSKERSQTLTRDPWELAMKTYPKSPLYEEILAVQILYEGRRFKLYRPPISEPDVEEMTSELKNLWRIRNSELKARIGRPRYLDFQRKLKAIAKEEKETQSLDRFPDVPKDTFVYKFF